MKVPIDKPKPDFENFIKVLINGEKPSRPLIMEYIIVDEVRRPICVDLLNHKWIDYGQTVPKDREKYLINYIDFWYRMGYDYVRWEENVGFRGKGRMGEEESELFKGKRGWIDEGVGMITSWEEFEKYPWPDPDEFDYFSYEFIAKNLPEGMGFVVSHGGGIFEHSAEELLGFEGLFVLVYDNPDLVEAVFNRVGNIIHKFHRNLLEIDGVGVIFQGDDMGFRSGTFLAPEMMKKLSLKWHKENVEQAHSYGRPYFLHSCGNLIEIMDDLIDYVGIDGKHSNEDAIMSIKDLKARFGSKIALLGGVDINILSQADEHTLRSYVKDIMNSCMPTGKFALGSSNSVPNYIPVKNYLIMLDEALQWEP